MATDTVQQIKDRLSIQDIISPYVKLKRAGRSLHTPTLFWLVVLVDIFVVLSLSAVLIGMLKTIFNS